MPPATHGPAYGAAGRRAPMIEGRGARQRDTQRGAASTEPGRAWPPRLPASALRRAEGSGMWTVPCHGAPGTRGFRRVRRASETGRDVARRCSPARGQPQVQVPPCAACMVYRSQARRILTCGGHVCSLLLGGAACSIILSAGESSTSAPTCSHQSYVVMTMRVRISHPRRVLNMKPCVCGSAS